MTGQSKGPHKHVWCTASNWGSWDFGSSQGRNLARVLGSPLRVDILHRVWGNDLLQSSLRDGHSANLLNIYYS